MKQILSILAVFSIVMIGCKKKDVGPPNSIPVVTTAALTNITTTSATGGGSIVTDGGTSVIKSGVVWSKTNNTPTLADSVVAGNTATGTFTSNITGLDFNNTYYVRAFATNSVGTGYGNVLTLSTANDTNKVRFTYNGQEVTYGIIISPTTGKKWLDRNLGATQLATAIDDYKAYGDYFQWGRPADGHQLMNWASSTTGVAVNGMTTLLATSDNPGHNNIIDGTGGQSYDWRSDNNSNRWVTMPQGPCPSGWHVPTQTEWKAEVSTTKGGTATVGGMTRGSEAYTLLKLTVAGARRGAGTDVGLMFSVGVRGSYWTSTDFLSTGGTVAHFFGFSTTTSVQIGTAYFNDKSQGQSVRCIKD